MLHPRRFGALTDPGLIEVHVWLRSEHRLAARQPDHLERRVRGTPVRGQRGDRFVELGRRLEVTHFSPLTGQEDVPENYHRVRYDLQPANGGTSVRLTQDNSSSAEKPSTPEPTGR